MILAAASAQEVSVAEQAWALADDLPNGSEFTGGSCAARGEARKQRRNEVTRREPDRIKPHLEPGILPTTDCSTGITVYPEDRGLCSDDLAVRYSTAVLEILVNSLHPSPVFFVTADCRRL